MILFIITSRIDEVFYREGSFGFPYLDPLVFTGDADASRNILSAITTGWATILGVAFSVTPQTYSPGEKCILKQKVAL